MKNHVIYLSKVRENLRSIKEAHEKYEKNIWAVTSSQMEIKSSPTPVALYYPPEDFDDYMRLRTDAYNLLNQWTVNITASLRSVPLCVLDNTQTLEKELRLADLHARKLSARYNYSDLMELQNCLRNASRNITDSSGKVKALLDNMNHFNDETLAQISDNLKTLSEKLMADSNTDQEKIQALQSELNSLKGEIFAEAIAIAVGIGVGIGGVTFGIVAFATLGLNFISLGMELVLALPLVICGTIVVIASSVALYKTVENYNIQTRQLNNYESDALQLSNCSSNYQRFSETSAALKGNVSMVIKAWDSVAAYMNTLADELEKEKENVSQQEWTELIQALEATLDECTAFEKVLKVLDISDMQATTANVTYEMDEEEVKAAMEQAKTYPIDEYMLAT